MLILLTYLALAIIVGIAADRKFNRNGGGWFVLSLFVSPVITFLLLFALGPLKAESLRAKLPTTPEIDWSRMSAPTTPVEEFLQAAPAAVTPQPAASINNAELTIWTCTIIVVCGLLVFVIGKANGMF